MRIAHFVVGSRLPGVGYMYAMDFPQASYYVSTKVVMTAAGQWPFQAAFTRRCIIIITVICFILQVGPQTMAIFKYSGDSEILIECFSPYMFDGVCAVKIINSFAHSRQFLKLIDCIRRDWQVWSLDREVQVLHEYTNIGKKFTIVYAVSIYGTAMLFMTQPLVPKIVDSLFNNGTAPIVFPFPVSYAPINEDKYYPYLMTCSYIFVSIITFGMIAADLMLIISVVHGCAIFAALGKKLKRMGIYEGLAEIPSLVDSEDKDVDYLASCIDRHNDAIEFAKIIEEVFRWGLFYVLGSNMIMLSITGYQIVTKLNDPQSAIRYIAFVAAQMAHLYVECLLSQILINHSEDVRQCLYDSEWYNISHKARKLLTVMTMRCDIPCQLTAGKVCIMSVPTFGAVVKTSMSYFTLLRSMEE